MPDKAALEAELAAADEAGDIRKVLELRRALKAAPAKEPAKPAQMEGLEFGGGDVPVEDLEALPSGAVQLGYGMSRAARGIAELPRAVGLEGLDTAGLRADEALYEATQGIGEEDMGGVSRTRSLRELGGEIAPVAALPANLGAGAASRLLSTLGINAAAGAAAPAEDPEAQRANAAMGAGFGAAFQAVPELAAGIKNYVFGREIAATGTEKYKQGLRLQQRTGIPLSEGALSQDPTILKREAEALGNAKEAFKEAEIPASLRYFNNIANKLDPTNIPDAKLIGQMADAFDSHIGALRTLRRANWVESSMKIKALAGDNVLLMPDKTMSKLQDLSEEILKVSPKVTTAEANFFAQELDKISRQGGLKIDDVDRMLQNLTAEGATSGAMFRDMKPDQARLMANELKDALKADMDAAITADPKNGALKMLNEAREQYAKDSIPINDLKGTMLEKWFGKDTHLMPESVLDRLGKLPPSEVETVTTLMDKIDPSIMQRVRGKVVKQSIDKAYNAKRAATDPEYTLTTLAGELEKNPPHIRAVFPDPTVRAEIMDGLEAVRRLSSQYTQRLGQSEAEKVGGALLQVGFLSPEWAARHIAKASTPDQLNKLFFTPEGRAIVTQLTIPNPSWQQRAAAAAALVRVYSENQ